MKYTREQLSDMAATAIRARNNVGNVDSQTRYWQLVQRCREATGLSTAAVESRIELLAMGVPVP